MVYIICWGRFRPSKIIGGGGGGGRPAPPPSLILEKCVLTVSNIKLRKPKTKHCDVQCFFMLGANEQDTSAGTLT